MYKDYSVYQALEKLIISAGVTVEYRKVPDDAIDGEIWARADCDARKIMMPDDEAFPDDDTATLILGHEMGHIISGNESPDDPVDRKQNEAECDLIGVYLYKLALMIAENEAEKMFKEV